MTNYDDYFTNDDKPFAENWNDALLLSNVFDFTVPIEIPTMFNNSTWVNNTSRRKCGVAIVTLKETLPNGISISTSNNKSVLTGTGTVKLGFYGNFNSFGKIKSISWENTGTVTVNLKTVNGTTIASNITKGTITSESNELRKLQEIVIELVLNNATLTTLEVVMKNKSQERYGADVGITDVTGLETRLSSIESKDTTQDGRLNLVEAKDVEQDNRLSVLEGVSSQLFNMVYPVGAIYMSVNSTNPSDLFGGSWERIEDRFLLASGTTYNNGSTGGAATVALTKSQMPRHNHTQASHRHTMSGNYSDGSGSSDAYMYTSDRKLQTRYTEYATPTINHTGGTGNTNADANGAAHNNMPPYLAVYIWKRIS